MESVFGPNKDDECCPWCGQPMDDEFIGDYDANLEAHQTDDPCEGMITEGIASL